MQDNPQAAPVNSSPHPTHLKLIAPFLLLVIVLLSLISGYFATKCFQASSTKPSIVPFTPKTNQESEYTVSQLETLIDKDKSSWHQYNDAIVSFKYPLYLGQFRDISADTDLANEDEKIAGFMNQTPPWPFVLDYTKRPPT